MSYFLKSPIIFALLLVLVQSYSEDDMSEAVDKCLEANDITREEFTELTNITSSEEDEEKIERKYKCFLHCVAMEIDIVDSEGYVDVDLIENHGQLSVQNRLAFSECKTENDHFSDMCEYAYKFFLCAFDRLDFNATNIEYE